MSGARSHTYTNNSQKTKAPEITPLAIAGGKMVWASFVIGVARIKNNVGGITSRKLQKKLIREDHLVKCQIQRTDP